MLLENSSPFGRMTPLPHLDDAERAAASAAQERHYQVTGNTTEAVATFPLDKRCALYVVPEQDYSSDTGDVDVIARSITSDVQYLVQVPAHLVRPPAKDSIADYQQVA